MAVLSSLRSAGRLLVPASRQYFAIKLFSPPSSSSTSSTRHAVVRWMSGDHKRTMEFTPTNFEWRKFKDHLNFYIMLGLIPIAAIITASNLFIGPAELIDIPEGYEPKHWEYYRSPITRFISRYLMESPEMVYERHMHFLREEKEAHIFARLEEKIDMLVGDIGKRHDSKYWYYIPANVNAPKAGRVYHEADEATEGYRGP